MDNNTSAPPSKVGRIMQALGEQAYYRSPILGQAMEVADVFRRPDHANDPKESRLGNIKRFVVDSAVQRSPILNKMAQMYDFAKSLGSEEPIPAPAAGGGAPAPTTSPSTAPGVNPAGGVQEPISAVVEKLLSSSDSKGVVDYFNDKENIYYKSLEESRTNLEKITGLLKSQFELMEKSFKIQEETNEREKTIAGLASVGRGELLPNALSVPPDMAQMDNTAGTEGEGEPGWLEWLLKNGAELALGGGAALGTIKSLWNKVRGTAGNKAKDVVEKIKPVAPKLPQAVTSVEKSLAKPATTSFGSKVAQASSKALPMLKKGAGLALRSIVSLPVQAAMLAFDPTEAGVDPQELTRSEIFKVLSTSGQSGLPKVREILSTEEGKMALTSKEYDLLSRDSEEARAYAASIYNAKGNAVKPSAAKPGSQNMYYSDTNATISRMMQDYTRDGDGTVLSPDQIRQKMSNSLAAMNNQNNLDIINKTNVTAKTTQTPVTQPQPPMIVGGPTNVNNGGNVTNIYNNGRDSLSTPQLAFNLASAMN